jgi:aspartate 1-decarboxylase
VIIMSYAGMTPDEAQGFSPKVVFPVGENNEI